MPNFNMKLAPLIIQVFQNVTRLNTLIFPKCQNMFLPLVFSSTILILKGMLIIILKKSCLEKSAYVVANNE